LWLKHFNQSSSKFNSFALKAFMVMPDLLLQKPSRNSKGKDNSLALNRRIVEWKAGNIGKLFREAKFLQYKMMNNLKSHQSPENIAKTFDKFIQQGRIKAAMNLLQRVSSSGLHDLTTDVIKDLTIKHPAPSPIFDHATLLCGPKIKETEEYLIHGIDEQCVMRAALVSSGSAGPSGIDAEMLRSLLCSNRHSAESKEIREQIALLTKNLLLQTYHPDLIEPLVACRLIPLVKKPSGVRPIGVGESLRRLMGKTISWVLKDEIKSVAGPLQTCANHGAGAEAAIHSMRQIFEKESTDAVLLIDASNAFNCLNRSAALHNIQVLCPALATYLINTYREPSRLFVAGKDGQNLELQSQEGTTQGDPLAMSWYAISTTLIISASETPGVSQVWLADDAAGAGKVADILAWYDKLVECGKKWGYLVNGSKSWLITKPGKEEEAKALFGDRVNITTDGKRHLGASLGSLSYRDEYATNLVDEWTSQLEVLCEIAKTYPQAAYCAYKRGFSSKFTYFKRTIPDFGTYLKPIQELLDEKLLPVLFGYETSFPTHLLNLFSLPVKNGGLGITNVIEDSELQFEGSIHITSLQTEDIINQSKHLSFQDREGFSQKDKIDQHNLRKNAKLKEKIKDVDKDLPQDVLHFVERSRDKGAGNWLAAIPLQRQGFNITKVEFRDGLRMRYNLPLEDIPRFCVCGKPFNMEHALTCKKGGFVSQRHNNIKDMFTVLLNKCCTNVKDEPILTNIDGETFRNRSTNTAPDARLDIRARNFWRQGQDTYFDIRVTHVDAPSHKDRATKIIFKQQEEEKKRSYNQRIIDIEHGTFTPLVIGTNGGMGEECQRFIKQLAALLSRKQSEKYASTITWIRTKLSFQVLRSTVLCVRGSRTPWNTPRTLQVSEDFDLHIYEAGLQQEVKKATDNNI